MEKAGANAIHIEDQIFPKKCGHMEGKRIVPQVDFIAKIHAFVDTRKSKDFLLFVRTDAVAVGGFNEAVDRGNAYLEAGADVIFVEALTYSIWGIDLCSRPMSYLQRHLPCNTIFQN